MEELLGDLTSTNTVFSQSYKKDMESKNCFNENVFPIAQNIEAEEEYLYYRERFYFHCVILQNGITN